MTDLPFNDTVTISAGDALINAAFVLPPFLAEDPVWAPIYHEMVNRLRLEAAGIEMTTLQGFLVERIASGYVIIRYRESNPELWIGLNQEKDSKAEWRSLVVEFNKMLSNSVEQRNNAKVDAMQEIILALVNKVEDADNQQAIRRWASEKLAEIGE